MRRTILVVGVLLAAANGASADLVQGIAIDFVTIGNPGNPGDTRPGTDIQDFPIANPRGGGSVDYTYRIGKYEVTNAQWYDFVKAAGAPTGNPTSAYGDPSTWRRRDNEAAGYVSWYEAAQFCNYLTSGDKSEGAYGFSGNNTNPRDFVGIYRYAALLTYGVVYVLPTEDEWYKAAYYTGSGYSTYANGTDIAPVAGVDENFDQDRPYDGPWDVGSGTQEQNRTFDMMGNVMEWNEDIIWHTKHIIRGGYFGSFYGALGSSWRSTADPSLSIGFRVAAIPEPATLLLLGLGGLMLRKRGREVF